MKRQTGNRIGDKTDWRSTALGRRRALLLRLLLSVCLLLHAMPTAWAYESSYSEDDDDTEFTEWDETVLMAFAGLAAGIGAIAGATAPWWAPPKVIDDDAKIGGRFPRHPYENGHGGFLILDNDLSQPETRTGGFFFRGSADTGSDFKGIERTGFNLHLENRSRFGIDAGWSKFNVKPGSNATADFDVGDANFIYRFAQSEHAQWWTGAGVNWSEVSGAVRRYDLNLTYGADICIGDPWMFSFQLDVGADSYLHGQATLGAQWKGVEIFAGFDYTDVEKNDVSSMIAGLRLWF